MTDALGDPTGRFDRLALRLEERHPGWLVRHPLAAGWIWFAVFSCAFVVLNSLNAPSLIWILVSLGAALPTYVATTIVLWRTPASHLRREPSVLSAYFGRFLGWVFAFAVWTGSVVVSTVLAVFFSTSDDTDASALDAGTDIVIGAVALLAALLLLYTTLRCAWFLFRLRGAASGPKRTRLPSAFLSESPRTHRIIVGLAHPVLLLVAGGIVALEILALVSVRVVSLDLPVIRAFIIGS